MRTDEVLIFVVDAYEQPERAAEQEEVVNLKAKLECLVCLVRLIVSLFLLND